MCQAEMGFKSDRRAKARTGNLLRDIMGGLLVPLGQSPALGFFLLSRGCVWQHTGGGAEEMERCPIINRLKCFRSKRNLTARQRSWFRDRLLASCCVLRDG